MMSIVYLVKVMTDPQLDMSLKRVSPMVYQKFKLKSLNLSGAKLALLLMKCVEPWCNKERTFQI